MRSTAVVLEPVLTTGPSYKYRLGPTWASPYYSPSGWGARQSSSTSSFNKAFVKGKTWRGAPTGKTGVELGLPGDVDRRLEEVNDLLDQEVVRPDF